MAAFVDGSRNVGGVQVADRWTLSPRALVTVGGRYEYFDYLSDAALFSPPCRSPSHRPITPGCAPA